eukprot:752884-Hanusia_phi.AAC.4
MLTRSRRLIRSSSPMFWTRSSPLCRALRRFGLLLLPSLTARRAGADGQRLHYGQAALGSQASWPTNGRRKSDGTGQGLVEEARGVGEQFEGMPVQEADCSWKFLAFIGLCAAITLFIMAAMVRIAREAPRVIA